MKNPKKFSGFGSFYPFQDDKKSVGEAAGFQDYLWGFGIRYAIISGNLIAKSIIEGVDYEMLWKKEIGGLMKTSVSNRLWFSWLCKPSFKMILAILKKRNTMKIFSVVYRPNFLSILLYPLAKCCFKKKFRKKMES